MKKALLLSIFVLVLGSVIFWGCSEDDNGYDNGNGDEYIYDYGLLIVNSVPESVTVKVFSDSSYIPNYTTPVSRSLDTGTYIIQVIEYGYESYFDTFQIESGTIKDTIQFDIELIPANFLLVAVYGGKLCASWDGGIYWENYGSGNYSSLYYGKVMVSKTDKNRILYLNFAEYGNDGLYLTTDGGKQWQYLIDSPGYIIAYGTQFVQSDIGSIIYINFVAGHMGIHGSLYLSENGGLSFNLVYDLRQNQSVPGLYMDKSDPYHIYFLEWYGGWYDCEYSRILESTDGGMNNSIIREPDVVAALYVSPNNNIYFIWHSSSDVMIDYKTSSSSWQSYMANNLPCFYYDIYEIIGHPTDDNTFIVRTDNGLFKTTDGGHNFTELFLPCTPWFSTVDEETGDIYIPSSSYGESGLMKSTDFGDTWEVISDFYLPMGKNIAIWRRDE